MLVTVEHFNKLGDRVQGDLVHTKAPDKVVNFNDIFLVRLRGQQGLCKPGAVTNLFDMANLTNKLVYCFLNNR